MGRARFLLAAAVAAGTLGGPLAGIASAAPAKAKTSTLISVTCDGQTYDAVVNAGNSDGNQFNPALTIAGHTVLIPVAFGPSEFTFSDLTTGETLDTETDPGGKTKGN